MTERYAAVYAHPDGDSTVSRCARKAAEYGYDGIVVRNHGDNPASYDPEGVASDAGIDVVTGVEVRADDPAQVSGYVGNHREDVELLCVHGGDPAINRFAVEQARVDVLSHPLVGEGSEDLDHVLVKTAAEHGVHLELDLGPVLRDTGGSRVRSLSALRKCWDLVSAYDAPYVVSTGATSHLQQRAWREVRAVGDVVGIDAAAVERGLSAWAALARRNRERLAGDVLEPGVWRGRRDGTDEN